ncbi:ketoacyl-ACP synthase III [Microbaculum marinisediminis]|uniref:Ketoacyl-ACP synthase III n=1 Tax=Microbaculum marinisediminis TaxID=2931392 RepID=A0AAW5R6B0_9HYPH|nr:ketoacyl-ACP synthase III [Microbaculum sp. A6E488]MCT8974622.1 ketoacyl-ACP synthase III [Microbaculum sp. A6E488]
MIEKIAVALPDWIVDADEVAGWTDSDPQFIREKVGIETRRFLRDDETGCDLASRAVREVLSDGGTAGDDLDFLITVTQTPDLRLPHMSAQIQNACGLPTTIMAFDMSLGCSGYVHALSVARALLSTGMRSGLIVTCDPYSKIMRRRDKATVTVFGDGATCSLIRRDGIDRLGSFDFGTDGSGAEHLCFQGAKLDGAVASEGPPSPADSEPTPSLHMNGREILNFMLERVPESVDRCLAREGLTRDDVDLFVFHQASRYMLTLLARRMGLDIAKVPIFISDTGNTVSSTIPIVLNRLQQAGELAGRTVLLSGFGVGLSWGTTVIRF